MGFRNRAAVAVSGALTAGAFATVAAALPAGAATFGTEQSGAGHVFGTGNNSAVVGASHTGPDTLFTRSGHGNTVTFRFGNTSKCVTDASGGLSLQFCNGGAAQKFDEVGPGSSVALKNEASHQYVQDNGRNHRLTTVTVHPDHFGHLHFTPSQTWRWINVSTKPGGGSGGGHGKNPRPPAQHGTWTATSKLTNRPDGGNGNPSNWANDNITRVATIKLVGKDTTLSDCGAGASHCYTYTGTLTDKGSFVTIPGNPTPNQDPASGPKTEKHPAVRGSMKGGATITFSASSDHPNAALVDKSLDSHGADPSGDETTGAWVEQFFTHGTTFGSGPALTSWSWSYVTTGLHPEQRWTDALNNGYGDLPQDGNITG